jgi:hypothetical protein
MKQNNNKLSNEIKAIARDHFIISDREQFDNDYDKLEEIARTDFGFIRNNFNRACDVRFGDSREYEHKVQIYAREDCGIALLRFELGQRPQTQAIDKEEARDTVAEIMAYQVDNTVSKKRYSEGQLETFTGQIDKDLNVVTDEIGVTEDIEEIQYYLGVPPE